MCFWFLISAFYAGKWAASDPAGRQEDVDTCIAALRKMKWAFSLSEDRIQTIRYAFNRRAYGATSVSPAIGGLFSEGNGPLRENPPAVPSMPSDLAGMASQDPFESESQQWSSQANYYFPQSTGQPGLDPSSSSLPSDSRGRHLVPQSGHHGIPVESSSSGGTNIQLRTWESNPYATTVAMNGGIPKVERLSPDSLEPQSHRRVSPPSAHTTSPGGFYPHGAARGMDVYPSEPSHGAAPFHVPATTAASQWDSSGLLDQSSQPPFVRIESGGAAANPSSLAYRHDGDFQTHHHGHGHGHHHSSATAYPQQQQQHPQHHGHGQGDGHSDDGSSTDAFYTTTTATVADAQNLNRTRHLQQFM